MTVAQLVKELGRVDQDMRVTFVHNATGSTVKIVGRVIEEEGIASEYNDSIVKIRTGLGQQFKISKAITERVVVLVG